MAVDGSAAEGHVMPADTVLPGDSQRRRLETIVVTRPRCPACGGHRLVKYRSLADQGDGSALWWVRCGDPRCRHRFRVLLE